MLDQGLPNPPWSDEGVGNGATAAGAATPTSTDQSSRPTFHALTEHVAGAVTDSTSEVLHRFARELHDVLSDIRGRLDEASARLGSELEAYRDAPAQTAGALDTLGEALGEIAGAQAAVDERLEGLGRETSALRSALERQLANLATTAAERQERVTTATEGLRASVAEIRAGQDAIADDLAEVRTAVGGELAHGVAQPVTESLEAIHEEIAALRGRLETGRKSSTAQMAADLSAVEDRLVQVEAAVDGGLVDAVFERMEQAFDRRFDALVQLIDTRLRDVQAVPPAEPARRGILRRA